MSKKLVLSIFVVKLDFMCQIQKMYYGYFSISINFRPQYLVFSSKMFGYGSVTVRPFLLWFGFGSAEHEKSLFGRPLITSFSLRFTVFLALVISFLIKSICGWLSMDFGWILNLIDQLDQFLTRIRLGQYSLFVIKNFKDSFWIVS